MRVVMLGSGNVATHLARALQKAGCRIEQIWSRNLDHARQLAAQVDAAAVSRISEITPAAELYIIAVKDDAISEIASNLFLEYKLVVHTSGSIPADVLSSLSSNYGVLYPLQTFSKGKALDFSTIPLIIEGNKPQTIAALSSLAKRLSSRVQEADSDQRLVLHVAAVFANNFTNYLYSVAQKLLEEKGLSFDLLRPLIAETAAKLDFLDPAAAQTGPALRGDKLTLARHAEILKNKPGLLELYEELSRQIVDFYKP